MDVPFNTDGGPLRIQARSGHMQPAVFSLFLWAKGDVKPTELGGGVLLDGEATTIEPALSAIEYDAKLIQAVVTVSLLNGKRYAPEVQIVQDGAVIGADNVDKTTTRNSIGVQFLFLMQGA
jgi:hypothetical protein